MRLVLAKPNAIQWPVVAWTIESVDLNFDQLFTNWRQLSVAVGTALTPVAGGVCYSTATALALTAAGTTGQLLQSAGTGTPTWTSDLLATTTIGSAYVYRTGGTDVAVADGGTGKSSYAVGDILHATAAGTLAGLANVAVGQVLVSGGVGVVAAWTANPTLSNVTLVAGGALRTGTTAADTLVLQAYDTDTGPGYSTFGTLTAGTAPSFDLAATVTLGGAGILTEG